MIGNYLQSSPVHFADVDIVHAGELVSHDPTPGVRVRDLIGERCERVSKRVERDAFGPVDLRGVDQVREHLADGVDVGVFLFLNPQPAVGLAKDVRIIGTIAEHRGERFDGIGPQRNVADDVSLAAHRMNAPGLQIDVLAEQDGAVGGAEAAVDPEQNHSLQLNVGLADHLPHVGAAEHPPLLHAALSGNALLLEPAAERNGMGEPTVFLCVVEHRDDAGAFTVESVRPELGDGAQMPRVAGEIFRTQIVDQASAAEVFQESEQGVPVIGQVAARDIAAGGLGVLLISEPIGELLERERREFVGGGAGLAAGVQVVLNPIVFEQSGSAIAILAEVVQVPVDPLLESAIGTGRGGESLDGRDGVGFVTTAHADRLTQNAGESNGIQWSSHSGPVTMPDMQKTTELPAKGSVAQRLEQGTHNPSSERAGEDKNAFPTENEVSHSAQSPNVRTGSIQILLANPGGPDAVSIPLCQGPVACGITRICEHCGRSFASPRNRVSKSNPLKFCSRQCHSASRRGRSTAAAGFFVTPSSAKAERVRANGLINKRLKLGWFTKPSRCQKCGAKRKLDGHHKSYMQPGHVIYVCRSCHMRAHQDPAYLAGIVPINTNRRELARRGVNEPRVQGGAR